MTAPVIDVIGWIAGALVLATFYLRTMIPLRCVAVASNVAFVSYGLLAGTVPIVALHLLLLPLNVLRLQQMRGRIRQVRRAARGAFALDMLVPYMEVRRVSGGTRLFERGDHADTAFLVLSGRVRMVGKGVFFRAGQLVGMLEIFAPDQRRQDSAVCDGEVELASIAEDRIWELCNGFRTGQRQRFLNTLIRWLGIAAIIGGIFVYVFYRQAKETEKIALNNAERARLNQEVASRNEQIALTRQLAAQSVSKLESSPAASIRDALDAVSKVLPPLPEAQDALRRALLPPCVWNKT